MENVQKRTLKMNVDLDNLDEMRRDVAPLMIPWWNRNSRGFVMKKVLFNLSDEQYKTLTRLAKKMGCSRSQALRSSIELYMMFKEWKEEDDQIIRRKKDGQESFVEIIG